MRQTSNLRVFYPQNRYPLFAEYALAGLERVFLIGGFHRALPGAVKLLQHLLGRAVSAIDNAVQRLEMTGLVAAGVIDVAAAPQAGTRQRQAFLGDFEQIAVSDPGLEAEPRHVVAQRLALVRTPGFDHIPSGVQAGVVVEQSDPERRQR